MADNRQYQTASDEVIKSSWQSMREISDMSTCIVLDGLPIVPNLSGVDKLREVLFRVLDSKKCSPKTLELAVGDTGASLGYAFLEYPNRKEADLALTTMNNVPIDKTHRLRTNAWMDFDTYTAPTSRIVATDSTSSEFSCQIKTFTNPYRWLSDRNAREQYLMKSGNTYDVETFWNDPHMSTKREAIMSKKEKTSMIAPKEWISSDLSRSRVLKDFPCWSPLGTYIVSMDAKGICTWVEVEGEWKPFLRFDHIGVSKFDFSPMERYLFTGSGKQCTLWDARLGKLINSFGVGVEGKPWPIFRWNYDETLFAQVLPTMIIFFDVKTLTTLPVQCLPDCEISIAWSPTSHHFIHSMVPTTGEQSIKVVLHEITSLTSRKEIAVRTIFGVQSTRLLWRNKGSYCLCVINMKSNRADKIDIFRVLKGDTASVEQVEIPGSILDVAWDPSGLHGSRFCVISTIKKGMRAGSTITFYHLSNDGVRVVDTLKNRNATQVSWSPCGTHLVLMETHGNLEFIHISGDGAQSLQMVDQQHHHLSYWDPSGRYFVTTSTMQSTSELDLGFNMYNFLGQRIASESQMTKFSHLMWRPRPPTPLSNGTIQNLLRHLSKHVQEYEKEDEERRALDAEALRKSQEEVRHRYYTIIQSIRDSFKAKTKDREKRIARLYQSTPSFNLVKKVREEVVTYM